MTRDEELVERDTSDGRALPRVGDAAGYGRRHRAVAGGGPAHGRRVGVRRLRSKSDELGFETPSEDSRRTCEMGSKAKPSAASRSTIE